MRLPIYTKTALGLGAVDNSLNMFDNLGLVRIEAVNDIHSTIFSNTKNTPSDILVSPESDSVRFLDQK